MSRSRAFWLLTLLLAAPVAATTDLIEENTIRRSFTVDVAPPTVVVDGFRGEIVISAHDADQVVAVVQETARAGSPEKMARARQEISLEITHEGDRVELYVDGPFRDRDRRKRWRDPGYRVQHDFELKVPIRSNLDLETVMDGEIRVQGVRGELRVSNVNDSVTLSQVGGTVDAKTVNGGVEVLFLQQPDGDCRFETVNGDVEVSLPAGLSAELLMKTRFGEIWSEHPVTALPSAPPTLEVGKGRYIVRTDPWARVQAGKGGRRHSFETLNGDLLVKRSSL